MKHTIALAGCASNEAKLASRAKVTRAQAESAVLKKAPGGTVKEAELEEEHGKLVWSFDIARPGTRNLTEVHVRSRRSGEGEKETLTALAEASTYRNRSRKNGAATLSR